MDKRQPNFEQRRDRYIDRWLERLIFGAIVALIIVLLTR